MKIWVDADACPRQIKEILFRAAIREKILVTLIANHLSAIPPSPFIKRKQVSAGFDVADDKIIEEVSPGDLVVTADIPLADAVIDKDGSALNPRGVLYSKDNIKERLAIRNISQNLRDSGAMTGGPASISKQDIQRFASQLDSFIRKYK